MQASSLSSAAASSLISSSASPIALSPATARPKPITCSRLPRQYTQGEFDAEVQSINTTFTQAVSRYGDLAAHVYSPSAPTEKVANVSQTWKSEARDLQSILHPIAGRLLSLQEKVPFLPSQALALSMQKLQQLWFTLFCIEGPVAKIQFVQNPSYADAYAKCKIAIKECEQLCDAPVTNSICCQQLLDSTLTTMEAQRGDLVRLDQNSNTALINQILRLQINTLEVFQHRMSRLFAQTAKSTVECIIEALDNLQISNLEDRSAPGVTRYFENALDTKLEPSRQKNVELESLLTRIATELARAKNRLQLSDVLTDKVALTELSSQVTEYEKKYPKTPLPQAANFKQASFFADLFRVNYQYANIKENIKAMKGIARGILTLRQDLHTAFDRFSQAADTIKILQGQARLFEACFHSLKSKLAKEREALLNNAQKGEVHAGLYYEALLQRMLSEIQYQILFFRSITTEQVYSIYAARERLVTIFAPHESPSKKTAAFYSVCKALRDNDETLTLRHSVATSMYQVAHEILRNAVATQKDLVLQTPIDKEKLTKTLIQSRTLDEIFPQTDRGSFYTLPPELGTFIEKEIIEFLYFYTNPLQENFLLDVMLTVLQTSKLYKSAYETAPHTPSRTKEIPLSEIVSHYERIRRPLAPQLVEAITTFSQYTFFMNRCKKPESVQRPSDERATLPHWDIELIFSYSQAQSLFARCVAIAENNPFTAEQKQFFSTILTKVVYPLQGAIQSQRSLPTYVRDLERDPNRLTTYLYQQRANAETFTNALFTVLSDALFGSSSEKALATTRLRTFLKAPLLNFTFPTLGVTRFLLARFIIGQVNDDPHYFLSNREQTFLVDFFGGYVHGPNLFIRKAFTDNFGSLHMELLLYKLLSSVELFTAAPQEQNSGVKAAANVAQAITAHIKGEDARGEKGFDQWKTAMFHCANFMQKPAQEHLDLFNGILNNDARLVSGSFYKRALEGCQLEMGHMLEAELGAAAKAAAQGPVQALVQAFVQAPGQAFVQALAQ